MDKKKKSPAYSLPFDYLFDYLEIMFVCQDQKAGDCEQGKLYSLLFNTYAIVCGALDFILGSAVQDLKYWSLEMNKQDD